ncbi:TBC1 domain family member 10B-like [Lineus longissimus]|uniref:TBC1 domain family member 10B-like n=1 Tax=Lineus longissimus TaxID=88925 RepID=UPI00315E0322
MELAQNSFDNMVNHDQEDDPLENAHSPHNEMSASGMSASDLDSEDEQQHYEDYDPSQASADIDAMSGSATSGLEGAEAGTSKQNGDATRQTDRYGFLGGDQYTNPEIESRVPVEILRSREVKWLDMLENWEKWMSKRFKKVKERCRKGVPPSIRARAWQYLCGSKYLLEHNRGRFEEYLKLPGDPKCIDDIEKDLHRQFPFHEMFMKQGGHGQEDLFRVLKAYTIHNPRDGYCQAQAPIAAVLLMHMPAEQAFWCLVSVCDKYLPGYYAAGLEQVQVDGEVLFGLLKKVSVPSYKHLKKQRIDPCLYMTEWFMCVYTRTLPWSTVLRVWDMFLCEGVKVMFRVALAFFRFTLGVPHALEQCPTMYETMEKLKHIPPEVLQEEFLVRETLRLPISERDMEKEHQYQIAKRKAAKEKANRPDSGKKKKKSNKKNAGPESRNKMS